MEEKENQESTRKRKVQEIIVFQVKELTIESNALREHETDADS